MESALDQLFGSKTRVEVLSLFVLHPKEKFYLREIERRTGQDISPIKKELDRLEKMGLVLSTTDGNRRYVTMNEKCEIYSEIKNLILKTVALGDTLKKHLKYLEGIEVAFIYGSFAKGNEHEKSDIDLFVVWNVPGIKLQSVLSKAKASVGREINCSNFMRGEIQKRMTQKDPFIKEVLDGKKIFLIGSEDDFKKTFGRR